MRYAIADASGRIEQIIDIPDDDTPDAHLATLGAGWSAVESAFATLDLHYVDGGVVMPRPIPPPPPALASGVDALWVGLPPGALVTLSDPVTGPAGSDHASPTGDLLLPAPTPGPWVLDVAETFPWLGATFNVEVAP